MTWILDKEAARDPLGHVIHRNDDGAAARAELEVMNRADPGGTYLYLQPDPVYTFPGTREKDTAGWAAVLMVSLPFAVKTNAHCTKRSFLCLFQLCNASLLPFCVPLCISARRALRLQRRTTNAVFALTTRMASPPLRTAPI